MMDLGAFKPSEGVYLVTAPTGAGKTTTTAAIVAWANATGIPAAYLPVFEPRAGTYPKIGLDQEPPFTKLTHFLADVRAVVKFSKTTKLIVLDSITSPMKAYSSEFKSQSTFEGGMQPSDRAFLDELSRIALDNHVVFLAVLNETLIPYVAQLAGAVEGIVRIQNVAKFTFNDRSSGSRRMDTTVSIPLPFVSSALVALGFGAYNPDYSSLGGSQYRGL